MPPPLGTGPGHQAGSGLVPPQWRARHKGGGREPHDPACPLVAGAPAEAEGCLGCGSLLPSPLCASHPGPCLRVLEACHAACLGQGHPPLTPPPTQHGTQSLCLEHVRSVRAGRAASVLHPGPRLCPGLCVKLLPRPQRELELQRQRDEHKIQQLQRTVQELQARVALPNTEPEHLREQQRGLEKVRQQLLCAAGLLTSFINQTVDR